MDTAGYIGLGLAVASLWFGIIQFWRAQRWKRVEFVAKEVKEFEADFHCSAAMQMLDWSQRTYAVEPTGEKQLLISDAHLISGLVPHTEKKGSFSREETFVRDCFDGFLDALERFESYIQTGLISKRDLRPHLNYWIGQFANTRAKRKDPAFYGTIWRFIDTYGYEGVRSLCERFKWGKKMPARTPVQ